MKKLITHTEWLSPFCILTQKLKNTVSTVFLFTLIFAFSSMNAQNETCATAANATVTPNGDTSQPINFDTTGLPDANVVPSCEAFDSTEQDLWYEFTTNSTNGIVLNLLSGTAGNLEGAIYDACGGNELFCFADVSSVDLSSDVLVTGLSQNTTYFIQVYTESFSEGSFSLAITDLPSCLPPTNLVNTAVSSTTADFSWDAVGNASNGYEYVVMPSGGDAPDTTNAVDTGTVASVTTTVQASGLTADTNYDFYVRSDCSGGDISGFSNSLSFFTGYCDATPSSNDGNGISQIDFNGNVIPSGGNITFEDFTATTVDIQQSVIANLSITFETGFTYDTNIWIDFNDNLLFEASELVFDGESTSADPTTLDASFPVDVAANLGNHRMRIGTADSGQSTPNPCYTGSLGVTIDVTINVTPAPACPAPGNLTNTAVSTTTADFSWNSVGNASSYEYVVMASGNAPDPGNAEANDPSLSVTSASFSGLMANTDYDFYVRADCGGGGDVSDWSSVVSFTTDCAAFTTPYSENFDGAPDADPFAGIDCWTTAGNDANEVELEDGAFWISAVPSSPNNVEFGDVDLDDGDEAILVSPQFSDLSDADNRIRFKAAFEDASSNTSELIIGVMSDPNDASTFVELERVTSNTDDVFTSFTVDLDDGPTIGTDQYVAIASGADSGGSDEIAFDDFVYEEIPSCFAPSNLTTSNITNTDVELDWNASPSSPTNGYDWEIVPAGDGQGNNVVANANESTTSVTVTGLSSNTEYDAYVRANCGGGDESMFIGPIPFKTDCSPFTTPYSENFDGAPQADPFAGIDCWTTAGNNANEVELEDTASWSFTTSSPNLVEFGGVNLNDNEEAILVSPQFSDLPDANNRIRFKAAFEDGDSNNHQLFVGIMSDPTDASTFVEIGTVTSNTDKGFAEYMVNLDDSALIDSNEYIAIAAGSVANFDQIALDDFVYEEIPTCEIPSNVQANNVTTNGVDLNWDAPSPTPGNGYDWEIVPAGNGQGNNVVASANESTTSVTATGLMSNTEYDAFVRANCGGGDGESIYIGPVNFRTNPEPTQGLNCNAGGGSSVVFSEEFDDNTAGWTGDINSSSDSWEIPDGATSANTGADNAFSGSNYMNFEASNTSVSQGSIVSPAIDLSGGQTDAELSFWMHAYGADMGTLEIGVGTSPTGTFTNEFIWSGELQTAGNDSWVNVGVNLSSYVGQTIYIELTQIDDGSSFEGDMSIDLFEVSTCVSCPNPTNLAVDNSTATNADLSWTATFPAPANGYDWEIVPLGDGQGNNVVASGNTTNTTVTANGLSAETDYDAFVRADCGGSQSSYIGPISFTTPCAAFTAPYSENFDATGSNWVSGGQSDFDNDSNTINSCWSRNPDPVAQSDYDIYHWGTQNDGTSSGSTGPDVDHTLGTTAGQFVYAEGSNHSTGDTAFLRSPSIDLSSLSNPELVFYYHMYGSDIGNLSVEVSDDGGANWNQEFIISGEQQTSGSDFWTDVRVDLSNSYSGSTVAIRFLATDAGTSGDIAIDDFAVIDRYIYNGTAWSPQVPGGNATDINNLIIESGTAPIAAATTVNEVMVQAGAILDLNADLTGDVTFKSDASGTAQLADATGNSITGNVTVERFIPAGDNNLRAFRFLSTAVDSDGTIRENWQEGATSNTDDPNPGFGTHITGTSAADGTNGFDATGSGQPSLLVFDNTATPNSDGWSPINDTDPTKLKAGNAYNLFVRGNRGVDLTANNQTPTNTTLRSTGTLATGSLTTGVLATNGIKLPELANGVDEFSLIGNPYQAIVDMTQVLNTTNSTNLNTNFYWVWDPNKGSQGGYVTVDLSNGSNPGTSDADEFVQPGQSFFIQNSSTVGTNNLTFTESAKNVIQTPTQVFSNNDQTSINLLLYTDQALNNNDSEADALGINFNPNGNNGVDQMDATKFTNIDENLARLNDGNLISIENRAMPVDDESLELFTNAYSASNYTFVVNVSNLPDGVDAYLVDDYNSGNQTLLSDGTNQISFTVDSSIPDSAASNRFSIDFDVETFGVDDNELADKISLYPNPTDGQFTIQTNGVNTKMDVNIYNMSGKQVFQKSYSETSDKELNVNAGNLAAGVYMVEMIANKESFTTQLIIK